MSTARQTKQAAKYWRALAKKELERLNWDKYAHPSTINARAATYEAAAKALEMELATGTPHCACHLIPMKTCAENAVRRRA
jgi:hypothetical protein